MDVMDLRRAVIETQSLSVKLNLLYRYGLPRSSREDQYDGNSERCSTSIINVTTGDVLTIQPPDGFVVALGVWNRNRPLDDGTGRYDSELYGGWNGNLNYTVRRENSFARYVFRKDPSSVFEGDELDGKVKIYLNNRILYYA